MDTQNQPTIDIEAVVDEHADVLFRYALLRVGKHDIAEDLVQETFLSAYVNRNKYQARANIRTWLIAILRNKITDHYRKSSGQNISTVQDDTIGQFFDKNGHWKSPPIDWNANPSDIADNREFWTVLNNCLKNLSEPAAQAFVLRVIEQIPVEKVCSNLQISNENLWVRLHRARIQLRRCLEVNWFDDGNEETRK